MTVGKNNVNTLYLDSDDEITTAIDKIVRAESSQINLVIPRGAVVLRSIINLRLLKKAVQRHNIAVIVVTKDETGLALALRAGFSAKKGVHGKLVAPSKANSGTDSELTINEYYDKPGDTTISGAGDDQVAEQTKPGLRAVVEAERAARMRAARATKLGIISQDSKTANNVPTKPVRTVPKKSLTTLTQTQSQPQVSVATSPAKMARSNNLKTSNYQAGDPTKIPNKSIRLLPRWPWKIIGVIAGGLIVLVLLVMTFGFAKATVSLKLKKDTVATQSEIIVKPKADDSKNEVTGRVIKAQQEESRTITPSGKKDVGQKATGSVTISNAYSDQPIGLSAGANLVAASGQVFHLSSAISVPGARVVKGKTVPGVTSTGVIADKFGEEYNLGPTSFGISGLSPEQKAKVSAKSDLAMTGGTKKTVTVLTDEDLTKAQKEMEKKLKGALDKEISGQVASDEEVLDEAKQFKSNAIESDVVVGATAKEAHVKLKMSAQALVDKPTEIRKKAVQILADSLKDNQELLNQSKADISWKFKNIDFGQNRLVLAVNVAKEATFSLDEQNILADIAGQPKKKAEEILQQNKEIEGANIGLVPIWRRSLPHNYGKIRIKYD